MELGGTPAYILYLSCLIWWKFTLTIKVLKMDDTICAAMIVKKKKNSLMIRMLVTQSVYPPGHFSITHNYQVKLMLHS